MIKRAVPEDSGTAVLGALYEKNNYYIYLSCNGVLMFLRKQRKE